MQEATETQVQAAPQAPAAPTPPAAPAAGATAAPQITITTTDAAGVTQTLQVPKTQVELRALREHREQIASQLTNVSARRRQLADEIRESPAGASRTGLEARMAVLDQRIIQLETDLASTGRLLTLAPAELIASTPQYPQGGDDFEEGLFAGGFTVLLFLPLAYYFLRRRWKKRNVRGGALPDMSSESARRLERLEQGMESIAIEIERVSEGQRFVTRLLAEGQGGVTSRRAAEPAHLPTIEG